MNIENLKQIVESYCKTHDIQAMSVCINKAESLLFEMTWGKTSKDGRRVKPETLFTIGSVSKVFTAIGVLLLKDRGLLTLDQPIVELIPDFSMRDERHKKITVRMLLNHSAGFYGNVPRGKYTLEANRDYLNQVKAFMRESMLKDEPGKFSVYCNDCFAVAEMLIESVTQQSYAEFVEENILIPLKMQHTEFPDHEIREGRIIYAKSPFEREYPQEYVNGIGSGGIYSTAQDLCILMDAVAQGKLLSQESYAEMNSLQTPNKMEIESIVQESYGLGWDTVDLNTVRCFGKKAMAKSGSTYGFGSYVICCPEEGLTASLVMSMAEGSPSTLLKTLFSEVMIQLGYPCKMSPLPVLKSSVNISGLYGNNEQVFDIKENKNELQVKEINTSKAWNFKKVENHWISDQTFFGKENPELIFTESEGTDYLIVEFDQSAVKGLRQRVLFAQRLNPVKADIQIKAANKMYLMDNEYPMQRSWEHLPLMLNIKQLDNFVLVPYALEMIDEYSAKSFIELPGNNSREMVPLQVEENGIQLGMYHYTDIKTIPCIINTEFKIQNERTVWFVANNTLDNIKMDGYGRCIMVDQTGKLVFDSELSWSMPEDLDQLYLGFTGKEGTTITVEVAE